METEPLSIILVKADSKGDRLLLRYPLDEDVEDEGESGSGGGAGGSGGAQDPVRRKKSPYCSIVINEDLHEFKGDTTSYIDDKGRLVGLTDDVLSSLLAVKQALREKKFELKINDVRLVGHPTVVKQCYNKEETNVLMNIVFALRASADHSVVRCYHELSKRLSNALLHEEARSGYFTHQMKIMITAHDEFTRAEEEGEGGEKPLKVILEESSLGRDLKRILDELRSQGFTQLRINKSHELSFCLPQKVHQIHNDSVRIRPEAIHRCFERLRPYYGILLLVDTRQLLRSLSPDASPALAKLIRVYSPIKSFSTLSLDASLGLSEVMKLACDLVYWGKAIVIYPLCESNVYTVAPGTIVTNSSPLLSKFNDKFPSRSLLQELNELKLPMSLRERMSPLDVNHDEDIQVVIWLLQQRLIVQLHLYLYFVPTPKGLYTCNNESSGEDDFDLSDLDKMFGSGCTVCKGDDRKEGQMERNLSRGSGLEEMAAADGGKPMTVGDTGKPVTSSPLSWTTDSSSPRNPVTQPCHLQPPTQRSSKATAVTHKHLQLLKTLVKKGYLEGSHHLEEMMYQENLKRSELLQLIDKFREVIIAVETEDTTLSIFYPHYYTSGAPYST